MGKLSQQLSQKTRTGQRMANQTGNGPCGPVGSTVPQSWGAACPTGNCTSENLAAMLGRAFAGERYPCRELTYWVPMIADAGGVATFDDNSRVTICPTRVIVTGAVTNLGVLLSRFEIGNQNQVVGDPMPVAMLAPISYQIIPFVTDCIRAGLPFGVTITGLTADDVIYFGIVGPTIG